MDLVRGREAAVAVVDSIAVIAAPTVDAVEAIAVGMGHHNLTVVAAEEVAETVVGFGTGSGSGSGQ